MASSSSKRITDISAATTSDTNNYIRIASYVVNNKNRLGMQLTTNSSTHAMSLEDYRTEQVRQHLLNWGNPGEHNQLRVEAIEALQKRLIVLRSHVIQKAAAANDSTKAIPQRSYLAKICAATTIM